MVNKLSRKHKDLQPWLDYFELLRTYERKTLLEVMPDKHEAYITHAALFTLSGSEKPNDQTIRAIPSTVKRIRAYAGWRSQHGGDYLSRPFALHVVKDEYPHDLLHTILITRRRVWWKLWSKTDYFERIDYKK